MQCQLVRELSELGCVGLAIKTRRYLDVIPEAMLEEANRLGFPLINIPVQYPLSKICKVVFGRLSGGGVEKADRFVSLYHSITESMLEADGVSRMLGVLSDFIGAAAGGQVGADGLCRKCWKPNAAFAVSPTAKGGGYFPREYYRQYAFGFFQICQGHQTGLFRWGGACGLPHTAGFRR